MPTFSQIYLGQATRHVDYHHSRGTESEISRKTVELVILNEVDKSTFDLEHKLAMYDAVLHSDSFDFFWEGVGRQEILGDNDFERYVTNNALLSFERPTLPGPDGNLRLLSPSPDNSNISAQEEQASSNASDVSKEDEETSPEESSESDDDDKVKDPDYGSNPKKRKSEEMARRGRMGGLKRARTASQPQQNPGAVSNPVTSAPVPASASDPDSSERGSGPFWQPAWV